MQQQTMSLRNPWKNSWTIRLVAAVDITFACVLVSIYLQKLLAPIYINNEIMRAPSLKLFLLGPIIFNSFQMIMSFNLFSAARRGSEPIISYAKAHTWFQFSTVMLVFLVLKLFLVLWFPPHGSISHRDIFGATLIVLETCFKLFGLFIVREFIDDLQYYISMFPTPQFYCIYTPQSPVSAPAAINPTNSGYAGNNMYPTVACLSPPQSQAVPATAPIQQNRNSASITLV